MKTIGLYQSHSPVFERYAQYQACVRFTENCRPLRIVKAPDLQTFEWTI